jgi:cytochrome P450
MSSQAITLFTADYYRNPYPILERLRAQTSAVRVINQFKQPVWYILGYNDANALLKDDRLSKRPIDQDPLDVIAPMPKLLKPLLQPVVKHVFAPLFTSMLDTDDPDHARLRNLVHKAFTPRVIANMQQSIKHIVDQLLDQAQARGEMEFMNDFAFLLPIQVISELLGVPSQDRQKFKYWANMLINASNIPTMLYQTNAFNTYMRNLLNAKRQQPQEDMLSQLVKVEEAGQSLNEDELLSMAVLLLIAGFETTVNLLGNGMMALFEHPEQMQMLRQDPALLKTAIEEFLRYDSPVHLSTDRFAKEDIQVGDVLIRRGDHINIGLGSANRDPQQFAAPHTLDICRENNRHLAFGQGIHYCLGAPLARMEAAYAFQAVLERFPNLRPSVPLHSIARKSSPFIRGLRALPVRVS